MSRVSKGSETTRPQVMLIITKAERGGAQTHVLELLHLRQHADFVVVSGEDGFLLEEARALGVETIVLPELTAPLNLRRDLRAVFAVMRLLKQRRPDLVHLHSSKAGLIGRLAAKLSGIPAVFTAHGWAFTEGASAARRLLAIWVERLAAPLSAAIIVVSEYDRILAVRFNVTQHAQTIHNALPAQSESLLPPLPRTSKRLRLVMVARFSVPKDQALLLRAAAGLPETEVWLIGDGELRAQSEALAERLGIRERVTFWGNRADVDNLLQQADVFCLCSHYEGFPISILEAMRASLPVVASNVGGVAEAVDEGKTGLLVAHHDIAHWRLALAKLMDDERLGCQMGEAGRARFESEFTAVPMLERTWRVYQTVLKRQQK